MSHGFLTVQTQSKRFLTIHKQTNPVCIGFIDLSHVLLHTKVNKMWHANLYLVYLNTFL